MNSEPLLKSLDDGDNRRIIVVTSVGVTAALARAAGFLQGSAFSCCVVNFVVAVLVMRLWEGVAFTAKAPAGGVAGSATDHVTRASYGFNHGGGTVDSASFCDDNGRFTRRLPDLILMVVLFGIFSLVSGIGRSAKASYVMAVNVDVQKEMENTAKWTPAEQEIMRKHLTCDTSEEGVKKWWVRSLAHDREAREGLGKVVLSRFPYSPRRWTSSTSGCATAAGWTPQSTGWPWLAGQRRGW